MFTVASAPFPTRLSERYEPTLREFLDVTDDFDVVRIGAPMFRRNKELGKFAAVICGGCTRSK